MISVLFPTTGRPERAEKCVERLLETAKGHELEVVCAVDNDRETADRLVGVKLPAGSWLHVDYSPDYRGTTAWNAALAHATGDPIVLAADDLDWQDGWLDAALKALKDHPDSLIGFNDGHRGQDLSTHYLMPRSFIKEVLGGVVAWPCYKHSFTDQETNDRSRAAGRYHWCEDAKVFHDHWLFGGREKDETDTRNLGGHPESEAAYRNRKARGFPDEYPAVLA